MQATAKNHVVNNRKVAYTGRRQKYWIAWVLVAPALLIRAFTTLYPFFMTFYNSLFNLSLFKRNSGGFIGFQNFVNMFSDSKFLKSLEFTAIFTVVSMIFHIILGVGLALMLNQKFKGKKLLRTVTLLPVTSPQVQAASHRAGHTRLVNSGKRLVAIRRCMASSHLP